MNFDLFTEAAVDLVNDGYWDPDFPGTYMYSYSGFTGVFGIVNWSKIRVY